MTSTAQTGNDFPIIVLGSGFAGVSFFRSLDRRHHKVQLVTNRNHFLFTPLLTMAATGVVELQSVIEPVRNFQHSPDEILIGKAVDIRPSGSEIEIEFEKGGKQVLQYHSLVFAVGATTATYNIPGVREHCLFFKELKDAGTLLEKVLSQFERATRLHAVEERKQALRFLVIGGGPTGVELACELHDLIYRDLAGEFEEQAKDAEIYILEASKEILAPFDQKLRQYAASRLTGKRIQLLTDSPVQRVEHNRVFLPDDRTLDARTIIWTGGIGSHEVTRQMADRLGVDLEKGRIPVNEYLRVKGVEDKIYAIGDCAAAFDQDGNILPATAQVAMKQGKYLAKLLSKQTRQPFHFQSMGMLSSLGHGDAIAEVKQMKFKGRLASWFWRAAYLTRLVSWRNKCTVAFDWFRVKAFGRNTASIGYKSHPD